jgi:hypothetical protein
MQHMATKVSAIPVNSHQRRLLEFLVFFLSRMTSMIARTRARNSDGGDCSTSVQDIKQWMSSVLAISFGLAIYRPAVPSLRFVQRAEFFVRCTKLLIDNANSILCPEIELRKSPVSNIASLVDLLDANPFSEYWRAIMAEDQRTVEYLSSAHNVSHLMQALLVEKSGDEVDSIVLQRSLAAKQALTRDALLRQISTDAESSMALFSSFLVMPDGSARSTPVGERELRDVAEIVGQLIVANTDAIDRFLHANAHINRLLIASVHSGNIANALCEIIPSISEGKSLGSMRLLAQWTALLLEQLLRAPELSCDSISGSTSVLGVLLHNCTNVWASAADASALEALEPWLVGGTDRMNELVRTILALSDNSARIEGLGAVLVLVRYAPTLFVSSSSSADRSLGQSTIVEACFANISSICQELNQLTSGPLGMARMQLVRILHRLALVSGIDKSRLIESTLVPTLVALFLRMTTHSILSSTVSRLICELLEQATTEHDAAAQYLLCQSPLLRHVIDASRATPAPPNRGYLLEIANQIAANEHLAPLVAATALHTEWDSFCANELVAANAQQSGSRIEGKSKAPWWFYCATRAEDAVTF